MASCCISIVLFLVGIPLTVFITRRCSYRGKIILSLKEVLFLDRKIFGKTYLITESGRKLQNLRIYQMDIRVKGNREVTADAFCARCMPKIRFQGYIIHDVQTISSAEEQERFEIPLGDWQEKSNLIVNVSYLAPRTIASFYIIGTDVAGPGNANPRALLFKGKPKGVDVVGEGLL